MRKLRYKAMAITVAISICGFLGAQRLDLIPGPWSKQHLEQIHRDNRMLLDAYSDAIAANPTNYMVYYKRGTQLLKLREYERALVDLDTAVKLSPIPLSLEALGGRADDTTFSGTRTLNLVVLVRTARAEIFKQLNRPDEALADLDQALAFDMRRTETFYKRGLLRAVTGRYDDAIADFDLLLNMRGDAQWYFARGVAKYLKADWTGAIADFRGATQLTPRDQNYLVWLAKAHLRAGLPMQSQEFAGLSEQGGARYVIESYMSDYNPAQFISGVRAGAGYVGRGRDYQCETSLFLGEWLVLRKGNEQARGMFNEAEKNCRPLSIDRAVASAEIGRLPLE